MPLEQYLAQSKHSVSFSCFYNLNLFEGYYLFPSVPEE